MPIRFDEIRRRRLALKLTLEEAGVRAGWAGSGEKAADNPRLTPGRQAMRRWHNVEAGRNADLKVSTLEAVAAVLGCKLDDLVGPAEPPPATRASAGGPGRPGRRPGRAGPRRT